MKRTLQILTMGVAIPLARALVEVKPITGPYKIDRALQEIKIRDAHTNFEHTLRCHKQSGYQLVLMFDEDQTNVACCLPGQHLSGVNGAAWDCCGAGHELSGSEKESYWCCPVGYTYRANHCYSPEDDRQQPLPPPDKQRYNYPPLGLRPGPDGYCFPPFPPPPSGPDGYVYPPLPPPPPGPNGFPYPPPPGPYGPPSPPLPRPDDWIWPPSLYPKGGSLVDGVYSEPKSHKKCESGIREGKCYLFKASTDWYLSAKGNDYQLATPNREMTAGRFQFCTSFGCDGKHAINPSDKVYIRDTINGKGVWLNNASDGTHIAGTTETSQTGTFSITKWSTGEYCLTGFDAGLRQACPALTPGITQDKLKHEDCLVIKLEEVPCDLHSNENNCLWTETGDCGSVDAAVPCH